MDLNDLTTFLSVRLKKQLPGLEASMEMSARMQDKDRARFSYKDAPKESSVMILLYEDGDTIRFPLIQRPEYPGVHSGQMALPGGKKESDESQIETALRETGEEIGVRKASIEIIGTLSSFYVFASNFQILPVVGKLNSIPHFTPQVSEVAEIISADLKHLLDDDFRKEKTISPRAGLELRAPYFDLEGKTVWGATAMMLNELKVLLKEEYD